jgi:hypothetical protein
MNELMNVEMVGMYLLYTMKGCKEGMGHTVGLGRV